MVTPGFKIEFDLAMSILKILKLCKWYIKARHFLDPGNTRSVGLCSYLLEKNMFEIGHYHNFFPKYGV